MPTLPYRLQLGRPLVRFIPLRYCNVCPKILFSVRAKLRNADPGYDFTSSFFLHCLYEDESGDPNSPDVGFLKGPLLIRVRNILFHIFLFDD